MTPAIDAITETMEVVYKKMQKTVLKAALMYSHDNRPNAATSPEIRAALRGSYNLSPDRDMDNPDPELGDMARQIVSDAVFRQGLFSGT